MSADKIIKNKSQGYGYKYTSLADFAREGVEIPTMRTSTDEFGEFVEYKDADGEWQRGARVVEMEMKGMNPAQAYGSALTYARRYTVALAHGIATDDDDAIEAAKPVRKSSKGRVDFEEVWKKLKTIDSVEDLEDYWRSLSLSEAQSKALKKSFAKRKEQLNGVE